MQLLPHRFRLLKPQFRHFSQRYASQITQNNKPKISGRRGEGRFLSSSQPTEIILSGIQPTGVPHLGNYLGALRQWRELQVETKLRSQQDPKTWDALYFSVVDLHALTACQTREERLQRSRDTFASLLAIGLDPKVSNIFFQSQIHHHSELMWILSTIASTGYLSRMTQWKSKLELPDDATLTSDVATERLKLGLFSYPVLQAADILLYGATKVPVGEDQSQHIEFARNLARSFNANYADGGSVLTEPAPLIAPAKRIMSLRDPTKKMSKSHADPKSRILITDTEDEIKANLKSAVTDSEDGISFDPAKRPGVSNLVEILKHITRSRSSCDEIAREHQALSKSAFKELVAIEIIKAFAGFRDRFEECRKPGNVLFEHALEKGNTKAKTAAGQTMKKVRQAIGLYKGPEGLNAVKNHRMSQGSL